MTHVREHGDIQVFHCDSCPEFNEGEPGEDFREVWANLREQGWVCFKDGDEWHHMCPLCAEST